MNILCLGGSYTGRYLADNFSDDNIRIYFLSRDTEELLRSGYSAISPGSLIADGESYPSFDLVLDTIPPVQNGAGEIAPPYLEDVSAALIKNPNLLYVLISTTAVYAQGITADEASTLPVMDELSDPSPETDGGKIRLQLEEFIRAEFPRVCIIRSGGIYGPGRSIVKQFRDLNFKRSLTSNRMISRIHVHDLCRLILSTAQKQDIPEVINAVDDLPSLNRETFSFLEKLLKIEIPGEWRTSPPEGRSIKSLYAKNILGGHYVFPTYREGFSALREE